MIGREVFGYRVEELIGKGSFASVYKVKKENESGTYVRALKHIVIPEKTQYLKIWNAMGKDTEADKEKDDANSAKLIELAQIETDCVGDDRINRR